MKKALLTLVLCATAQLAWAAPEAIEEPVDLGSGPGAIHGTLRLPAAGTAKVPVVLLIAGSGPTDRDGNSAVVRGKSDSLKLLANALADAGFASLRYDKRGIAASAAAMSSEADMRFETYVQDAAGWVRQLAGDPRFSGVAIAGHSEGSLIGMLAAQQGQVGAFASIAGAGSDAAQLLGVQMGRKLPPELAARNEQILRDLKAGKPIDDVPPALASMYRASVRPYMSSYFKYAPPAELAKLRIPVAIFQGDTDIQVSTEDARLLAQAKPEAESHIVAGMNHVLKMVPADRAQQIASYSDPSLPIAPALVETLVSFLRRAMPAIAAH